ncbi:hypothetical protein WKK05_29915 [Nostoc sp. UHCC 0302]
MSVTRQWEGQAVSNGNNYVILEIAMITDDLEVTIKINQLPQVNTG